MDLARAPCRAPLTARKKGSGYENDEFICWIANEYQRINQVRMVLFLSGDIHEGI